MSKFTVDRRLYKTVDGNELVEEGDPRAATLYASPGKEVPYAEAARFGLVGEKQAEKPADKSAKEQPRNKQAEKAGADK